MHRHTSPSLGRPVALIISILAGLAYTGSAAAQTPDLTSLRSMLHPPQGARLSEPAQRPRPSDAAIEARDPMPVAGPRRTIGRPLPIQLQPASQPIGNPPVLGRPPAQRSPAKCATPMSLMLHSSFGADRMAALADAIIENGLQTATYREVLQDYQFGRCPKEQALIVSIDDLGSSWLRPDFVSMIQAFTDRGLVLVVGVVVHGPQDPQIWEYLRRLEQDGSEVASHTLDHHNLPELGESDLEQQIEGSRQVICDNLGRCPTTLILPYGNIDRHGRVLQAAQGYAFVVGIPGGKTFGGEAPYYLGRISPDIHDQARTLRLLEASFGG